MTAEELLAKPGDGFRYELVEGELRRMARAGNVHGYVAANLLGPLHRHIQDHQLGRVYAAETGFKLSSDPDTVRAPDVAFVARGRPGEVGQVAGYWPGAPDLAAEVASPFGHPRRGHGKVPRVARGRLPHDAGGGSFARKTP